MGAYILRRLLLVIPTLLGIMIINFTLTEFVPGGPIQQVAARLEGEGDSIKAISGSGADAGQDQAANDQSGYIGARGLPPEFLAQLEVDFGFARIVCPDGFQGKPTLKDPSCKKETIPPVERFFIMMWHYMRFDFGQSYFRSTSVVGLILEKLPVSISFGLWSSLLAYGASRRVAWCQMRIKDITSPP